MASSAPKLNGTLIKFIQEQPLFFVATAAKEGRVNMSPKGLDSLRVLNEKKIVWINLTGSGNETAAHLLESSRMTLMFCGFGEVSRTLRVFGTAKTYRPNDDNWKALQSLFPALPGARQIFELDIDLVTISCGSSFPRMSASDNRPAEEFLPFWEEKGDERTKEYWANRNTLSIDGKPTGN